MLLLVRDVIFMLGVRGTIPGRVKVDSWFGEL